MPSAEDFRRASAHFPLVGGAIGALMAAAFWGALRAGPLVAGGVAVACGLLITGALHEDGLADTADALGASRDPARILEILKDSRIGSFGGAALALSLLLRVALLARLDRAAPWGLILGQCWSRLVPVALMAALPYVTPAGAAKSQALVEARRRQVLGALLGSAAVGGALGAGGALDWWDLAAAALGCAAAAAVCRGAYVARLGGVTGDLLGASQQVSELALLLSLALARGGVEG